MCDGRDGQSSEYRAWYDKADRREESDVNLDGRIPANSCQVKRHVVECSTKLPGQVSHETTYECALERGKGAPSPDSHDAYIAKSTGCETCIPYAHGL
jgi:hypothetical protein